MWLIHTLYIIWIPEIFTTIYGRSWKTFIWLVNQVITSSISQQNYLQRCQLAVLTVNIVREDGS